MSRSRRVVLPVAEVQEILVSRDWCLKNDFSGFARFYDELLTDLSKRRALPRQFRQDDDERDDRRDDRR